MTGSVPIGFTVYRTRTDELVHDMERAVRLGADHVELALSPLELILGGRVNRSRLKAVADAVRLFPLDVLVHAPLSLSLMDPDHADLQRQVASGCLDICAELGAPLLVVHPGWMTAETWAGDPAGFLEAERTALHALAEQAAHRSLTLGLENMPVVREVVEERLTCYGLDPAAVADQVRAVGHPALLATLDISHAYLSCRYFGWDLAEKCAVLASVATHLHLHDSFGRSSGHWENLFPGEDALYGEGDLHLPLGWGDLPYESVMPRLPMAGSVTATLETGLSWRDEATAAESLARARALCAALPGGGPKA